MPSIAEATRARRGRRRRRLAAGVGLVMAGALLVGAVAAGAGGASSVRNGVLVGGLAMLACLAVLADRVPLGEYERTVAAVGAAVGLAGLLLFWALAPGDSATAPALAALWTMVLYVAGIVVMGAAVLAAASVRSTTGDRRASDVVAWERTRTESGTAVDGGEPDDEFSPSLDDD